MDNQKPESIASMNKSNRSASRTVKAMSGKDLQNFPCAEKRS